MPKIEIDELRCKGCGLCTIACPKNLIDLSNQINNHGYTPAVFLGTKYSVPAALYALKYVLMWQSRCLNNIGVYSSLKVMGCLS